MGIPPLPLTSESTPVSTAVTPPGLSEAEWIESAPEQLVPVPVVEAHLQLSVTNQLGGSYNMEAQVTQVGSDSCHTSISCLNLVAHAYLKNHFNEL